MLRWLTPLLALAGPTFADPARDEAAIDARLAAWAEAFNARDAEGACDLFAPDLKYSVPELVEGTRATMCGNLDRIFARAGVVLVYAPPRVQEVMLAGDVAIVRVTWTLTTETAEGRETAVEEGLDVFRRQPDGRWSLARFVAFTPDPKR